MKATLGHDMTFPQRRPADQFGAISATRSLIHPRRGVAQVGSRLPRYVAGVGPKVMEVE